MAAECDEVKRPALSTQCEGSPHCGRRYTGGDTRIVVDTF